MKKRLKESKVRAYQNRSGEISEEKNLPPVGWFDKLDYRVFGRAVQRSDEARPQQVFPGSTCMIEFQPGKERDRYWSDRSFYIQPKALELVGAPLTKYLGDDFIYNRTSLPRSVGQDVIESWKRMRLNVQVCTCADDLYLELQTRQTLCADQWERRADIVSMLADLANELSGLYTQSEHVWIVGL